MANKQKRFLALLRGINVGGNNVISKEELKTCFQSQGFENVLTYIQSGNVLFTADETDIAKLTTCIETAISKKLSGKVRAVVFSHQQYKSALKKAHADWGNDDSRKHNAIFTVGRLKPAELLAKLPPPVANIETVSKGPRVVYWSVCKEKQSISTMMKLAKDKMYKQVTVRNHNTTLKLLQLFDQDS